MATKPKRRMKYPPGSARRDTLTVVLDNLTPVTNPDYAEWLSKLRLHNHSTVTEMVQGRANKQILQTYAHMHNLTRGLVLVGYGAEHARVVTASEEMLPKLVARVRKTGSFTMYADEIQIVNALLELHEAQMEVALVGDVHKAYQKIINEVKGGKSTLLTLKPEIV